MVGTKMEAGILKNPIYNNQDNQKKKKHYHNNQMK
jgi:hypothetical protein